MYIAMNRFKIKPGCEQEFIDVWAGRDSYLDTVPGFKEFHLLRGPSEADYTLFSSHAVWESKAAFEAWTQSDAFKKAHANAGKQHRDIYAGPAKLECFDVVL
ncbi:antibiotic biosynthesis monooxygenase [Shewanella sp. NFH-SH190041]|uniref:antibiotic biosynthesis monooxygenase family protein n=1 Tax=Shewanella sp. NFH-SH190041 TaxID=2950245 RepID=UPI0021C46EB5|nr:antibiotic biosynthesis monooxygenase [Shewanella sp. NFH-SH190041]BDM65437.1 antibiotic biosynthesis monooxygenase [Shewanella sp. NFH-SH190041]